ncbi:hypothetical protein MMC30_007253 [Trapelia coarctata]|nr:hypothetical protein [Trapelia coarctata]
MSRFGETPAAEEVAQALSDEIHGKIVLITGVSPGSLGAEAARVISLHHPRLPILAGRSIPKLRTTETDVKAVSPSVNTRLLELDLGSQEQIRKAAAEVNGYEESIDVLYNNAGIMAAPYATTKEGLESQFGTNHIGHFLFTNLIMPRILAAGKVARIVNISSWGHNMQRFRFDDYGFQNGASYEKWKAYGQAKTANILFSVGLVEKLGRKGVLSFSLHPGTIRTNLGAHLEKDDMMAIGLVDEAGNPTALSGEWVNIQQGTATHIVAGFDPSITEQNGGYLEKCKVDNDAAQPYAKDKTEATKLWALSEELVGQKFEY